MGYDDRFWRDRVRPAGHSQQQAPQFLDDVEPGKPYGVPGPDYAERVTEPGIGHPCVLPKHWYLGSLPPELITRSQFIVRNGYSANGTQVVGTYEIPQDTTFVAFLYHFFAETDGLGGRTALLQPHEFLGFIELKMRAGTRAMPYIMGANISGVEYGGMPLLCSDPWGDWQQIPIFLNGQMDLQFVYTNKIAMPFVVRDVGFILDGFTLATAELREAVKQCSVLNR